MCSLVPDFLEIEAIFTALLYTGENPEIFSSKLEYLNYFKLVHIASG